MNSIPLGRLFRVCVWLCAVGSVGQNVLCADNSSDYQSKTPPKPLTGKHGDSGSLHFFSHLSDVDKQYRLQGFYQMLRNEHGSRLLSAKWERAGIEQIRLRPGRHYENTFQTSLQYQEDPKAVIQFGPGAQYRKVAPTYVCKDRERSENASMDRPLNVPPLHSRVAAMVDLNNEAEIKVDLTLTSEVKEHGVVYLLWNRGSTQQRVKIPGLTASLNKLERDKKVRRVLPWQGDPKKGYLAPKAAPQNKPLVYEVDIGTAPQFRERIMILYALTEKAEPLASGRVSLYLPEVK